MFQTPEERHGSWAGLYSAVDVQGITPDAPPGMLDIEPDFFGYNECSPAGLPWGLHQGANFPPEAQTIADTISENAALQMVVQIPGIAAHPTPRDGASILSGTPLSAYSGESGAYGRISPPEALGSVPTQQDSEDWEPSVASSEIILGAQSNNQFITHSLLQIYHDVLENNLACWLAEENCPYKMSPLRPVRGGRLGMSTTMIPSPRQSHEGLPEWGTIWSNRIYKRVIQLDKVAQRNKQIRLTRRENQAASRALDLAIMAFATQYAQGNQRSQKYGVSAAFSDGSNGFEKNLQLSIWEQARQALQEVSGVECYRVVYAELILGFVDNPGDDNDYSILDLDETSSLGNHIERDALSAIQDIIAEAGPPVFLERAARKIQVLRSKFTTENGFEDDSNPLARENLSGEDRRTIGLLYWLAVMLDTVSSSMNERPVALPDEECKQDVVVEESLISDQETNPAHGRWQVETFLPRSPDKSLPPLHWPCPYEIATTAIARSAPIKILIFRHVSYLQSVLRRKRFGVPVEDAIQGVILTYRYFNTTYGSFYRDLVRNYDSLPTRIKSWFVCIYIPWHMASMMLANMIDQVDKHNLGILEKAVARTKSNMTERMRKSSAIELADLAAVTVPPTVVSELAQQLPEYHFAVNEGPLMTEPWTVLLVRAFTRAALFHLSATEELRQHDLSVLGHESEELGECIRRADDCIRALWSLGKKSVMSRKISIVLREALHNGCYV